MIQRQPLISNGIEITAAEHQAILTERRRTLDAATAQGTLTGPLPVTWRHGWICVWQAVRRDSDGSLLVVYTALDRSRPTFEYVRRVRHVQRRNLRRQI